MKKAGKSCLSAALPSSSFLDRLDLLKPAVEGRQPPVARGDLAGERGRPEQVEIGQIFFNVEALGRIERGDLFGQPFGHGKPAADVRVQLKLPAKAAEQRRQTVGIPFISGRFSR